MHPTGSRVGGCGKFPPSGGPAHTSCFTCGTVRALVVPSSPTWKPCRFVEVDVVANDAVDQKMSEPSAIAGAISMTAVLLIVGVPPVVLVPRTTIVIGTPTRFPGGAAGATTPAIFCQVARSNSQ